MGKFKNLIQKLLTLKTKLTKDNCITFIIQLFFILVSSFGVIKNLISTDFVDFIAWGLILGISIFNIKKLKDANY